MPNELQVRDDCACDARNTAMSGAIEIRTGEAAHAGEDALRSKINDDGQTSRENGMKGREQMSQRASRDRGMSAQIIGRRLLLQGSGAVVLGSLLAACGGSAATPPPPAAQASVSATTGGAQASSTTGTKAPASASGPTKGGSLRVGIISNPISLDPSPSNGELLFSVRSTTVW